MGCRSIGTKPWNYKMHAGGDTTSFLGMLLILFKNLLNIVKKWRMEILMLFPAAGVANQSETSHIAYYDTTKNHIMHVDTHEHHPISSSLTHIPLLSYIYCKYHTPIWQLQNCTSHLLLCMLFSGTSGNYVRVVWNQAKTHRSCLPPCPTALFCTDHHSFELWYNTVLQTRDAELL